MSNDILAGNIRFVDIAGTDAILRIEKKKNKQKESVVKVYPVSKKELTEHTVPQALFNGAVISATIGLWITFFTSVAPALIPLFVITGIPIFAILSKAMNNFLVTKKDFTIGGRDEDKPIYEDPLAMPVFELEEELFDKSSLEVINAYSKAYQEYIFEKTGKNIPDEVERMMKEASENEDIYGYDNSFSKVFSHEENKDVNLSAQREETINNNVEEIKEVLQSINTTQNKSEDEMMTRLIENDGILEENRISIRDKRSSGNTSYFGS